TARSRLRAPLRPGTWAATTAGRPPASAGSCVSPSTRPTKEQAPSPAIGSSRAPTPPRAVEPSTMWTRSRAPTSGPPELGIYHYDGSSWTRVVNNGHGFNHTRCFDDSDCFVYDKQTSTLLKYDLTHNSLTTATNIPFVPAPYADSVVLNSNRTVLWAINGIKAAYCQLPCTSWTNANLPAGTDFIGVGIYGDSTREAWAVGSNASGNAAMYRYVSGTWTKWTAGIFASDNGFAGIGFQGNNEGWTDDFSGRTYHYTGSNSPPFANFTKDKTSATTIDVVNVDGSTSSDPDGDPITYSWNWGDNTAGVSTATASHRYTKSGTYQIQLTVTDTNGA